MANANANAPVATPVVSALTLAFGAAVEVSQLNFAVSIAFETLAAVVAPKSKFKMSEFAREVEKASGFSLNWRTVANIGSVSKHLQDKFGPKIGSYTEGHTQEAVLAFSDFLRAELSKTTYTLTLDDIAAFCKGEKSRADKRKEAEELRRETEAALAKAEADRQIAAAAQPVDAELAKAQKAKSDAEEATKKAEEATKAAEAKAAKAAADKLEADKRAASLAEDNRIKAEAAAAEKAAAEKAAADAEAARKQAESFAVRIGVTDKGHPDIVVALNPSPAFLEECAKQLKAMAAAIRKQQAASLKAAA